MVIFFFRNHGHEELLSWLLNQILTTVAPTWRAKDVGGNDTYGITRIPTTVAGHGVVRRAGSAASTKAQIVYPRSGWVDA